MTTTDISHWNPSELLLITPVESSHDFTVAGLSTPGGDEADPASALVFPVGYL